MPIDTNTIKNQIQQKLQLLAGAPQAEDLLSPEAKRRLTIPTTPAMQRLGKQAIPEIPKTGDFFGRDVLTPEERFAKVPVSPTRSILRFPGRIGQVQEKVARFLAPQTPEEEATEAALGFTGISGAVKKTTGLAPKTAGKIFRKLEPLAQEARKVLYIDKVGKKIVSEKGGIRFVVNDLERPTFITAWDGEKQIGSLKTAEKSVFGLQKYQQVGSVEVNPKYRNQGIATELYKTLAKYLPENKVGIAAYSPDVVAKKAIPRIYEKLGGRLDKETGNILLDIRKPISIISKELEPLATEARKYKSAEEFVRAKSGNQKLYEKEYERLTIEPIRASAKPFDYELMRRFGSTPEIKGDMVKVYRLTTGSKTLRPGDNVSIYDVSKFKESGGGLNIVAAKMGITKLVNDPNAKLIEQWIPKKDLYQTSAGTQLYAPGGIKSLTDFYNKVTSEVSEKVLPKTEELPGNLQRLNVAPIIREHLRSTIQQIKPELEAIKGGVLKNVDVVEAAQRSDILRKVATKETTLKSEAAILRTRQHLAELAKGGTLTPDFINTLRIVSSQATQRGRELQALGIEADPALGTIKTKIIKELLDIGKSTDDILRASEGIDFTNAQQVTDFYRKFIKPNLSEIIDEYRYINLLSSPKTHIVNAFSNILQTTLLRPATRLASGVADTIASKLTGKEQQFYIKQVPAYYKGAFNAIGEATSGFLKALRGQSLIYRPDISRIPTNLKVLRPLQVIPRILEASDIFFRTLATKGEVEALMSKGITEAQATQQAAAKAEELVFRKALDPSNKTGQGVLLSGIDKMTSAVYKLRDAPGFKWFIPFVQTPMNILKQGIEYSPLGLATLPKNVNKIEQIGKSMVGSTVFAGAGWLALNDRTTWAAPISKKEKAAFYAAGLQPYAVKLGNKWVSYSRLGPLAYPLAMAAAIKFYTKQNPAAISDTELQKTTKVLSGIAQFFSDQSYVEGIGDFVDLAQGDTTAVTRAAANVPAQLIPLASLLRWTATLIDPIYRKTESKLSVESIIKNLEKSIPFLSKGLEPHNTPFGQPSKRQFSTFQAFSPVGVTQEQPSMKGLFNLLQEKRRLQKLKDSIKERLQQRIQEQLQSI